MNNNMEEQTDIRQTPNNTLEDASEPLDLPHGVSVASKTELEVERDARRRAEALADDLRQRIQAEHAAHQQTKEAHALKTQRLLAELNSQATEIERLFDAGTAQKQGVVPSPEVVSEQSTILKTERDAMAASLAVAARRCALLEELLRAERRRTASGGGLGAVLDSIESRLAAIVHAK